MSSRSIGMKYEREMEVILNEAGYTTYRVRGSTMYGNRVDIFGLFDIIGFNKCGEWILVQVKSDYRKKVHNELEKWMKEKHPKAMCLYAIRKKRAAIYEKWRYVWVGEDLYTTV